MFCFQLWQYKAGAEIFSSPALSFVPRLSAENANPSKILQQTNEILQLSTEKSRRPIETPQYSSEAPQCLSKIPQYPSETPQYTSETPKDPSETPQCLSETPRFSLDHSTPDIIEKPQEKEKLSTFRHPVLVIGSQDNGSDQHYIHCLDMQGQLLWKYAMGSRVYSTCFYFEISEERWEKKFQIVREELQRETESQRRTTESLHQAVESQKEVTESRRKATESCGKVFEQTDSKRSNSQSIETCRTKDRILREQNQATSSKKSRGFVVACSTKGELCVLDAVTGTLCSQYTFPYEVFSSPVVHDGRIVVGCRDDFVYCLDMEWELK